MTQADPPVSPPTSTIAQRIDSLFQAAALDGHEPSYRHVSDGITSRTGVKGRGDHPVCPAQRHRPRPRISTLKAIAAYFGVPLDYFSDDHVAREVDQQLTLLRTMRNAQVKHLALRADGLSEQSLQLLHSHD
jgi:hypothetical protein